MFKSYLKIALRNLLRHKGYSFINIAGLAIGMACCLVILFYVNNEIGYDAYHAKKDRLYRVTLEVDRLGSGATWYSAISSIVWAPTLQKDYPEVESFVRLAPTFRAWGVQYGDKQFDEERLVYADPSVFELFSWPLISGNPATVLDEPNALVLSEAMVEKYFGDEDPIGKTLIVDPRRRLQNGEFSPDRYHYKVTGVMKNIPRKTHVHPDFIVSFISANEIFGGDVTAGVAPDTWFWRGRTVHNYLLLREGVDPKAFEAHFPQFLDKYVGDATTSRGYAYHPYLTRVDDIHLEGNVQITFEPGGDLNQVYLFSIVAFFILLIAGINYVNMATARASMRAKEVGVRKTAGAVRKILIGQFLGESVILSFLAFVIAMFLAEMALPVFYSYINKELLFDWNELPFAVFSLAIFATLVGVVAGTYPAFFLSSYHPAKVLKPSSGEGVRGARLRKTLAVAQFAITVFFIIATLTVYKQLDFMRERNLGFNKEQVLVIPRSVTRDVLPNFEAFRTQLLQSPHIEFATYSTGLPGRDFGTEIYGDYGGGSENTVSMTEASVEYDYVKTLGLEIIAGRDFSREMGTDPAARPDTTQPVQVAALVNEQTVKQFGWGTPEAALGQRISRDPVSVDWVANVIGVVRDFNFRSLQEDITPLVLFINPNYMRNNRNISIKFSPAETEATLAHLKSTWQTFAPDVALEYFFLDEDFNRQYQNEERLSEIFVYFSSLAIFIACLGLFGLAAFEAEKRTKEIGIRKVLGASVQRIIAMMSSHFLILVAVANVIAWPLAWYAMNEWLQGFAYRTAIEWWVFALAGGLALLIALLTVSTQAIRAALANPVESLRYE